MLTGKDIHAAFRQYDDHAKVWEDVSEYGCKAYEAVAETLNASYIAPLQGVVKELISLLEDDDLMIEDSPDGWHNRKRKAYDTAQQLLGEDIPC